MNAKRILFSITLATPLFFIACKKNKDSLSATSSFKYKLTTTNRNSIVARIAGGNVLWTSGYASATQVKFEAKKSDNSQVEFKSSAMQHIDLFASLVPVIGNISLPADTYKEVEFKGELAPSGSDAALELNGTFTSGAVTTPVTFTVNSPLEIKTEKNNVVIADNSSYSALTNLNLSFLTQGITEAMLNSSTKTGGKIIISANSNTNLYTIMLANLDNSDEVEFEHDLKN